jgi:carbon-monoxide dehydrogenase medium subunit
VKPAPFDYVRPRELDEVLGALAEHGGEAKILAGGQSLMPLLNFRMLRPAILVDVNKVEALSFVREDGRGLRLGALTRHHMLETSPLVRERFPVLAVAMAHVAHLAIRNRGTIGGSLSHADPAAELPMMAMLLDAVIHTRTPAEERRHAASDFFLGPLTSALEDDEIVTEIELPGLDPGTGWGFEEVSQRSGDFAIAAAAALVRLDEGRIAEARIALMGIDETPVRMREIEAALFGAAPGPDLAREAAARAAGAVNPNSDLKASADYRRHLVRAIVERTLRAAWERAGMAAS